MSYLLIFCAIGLTITLHEFGHLVAAKRLGIPVARFSVGFGPKLCGIKIVETEYCLSIIPCGGYVQPVWDAEEAFQELPVLSRLIFALGGQLANICGAFLGLSLMNTVQLGFSVHSAIYLPLEQIASIAIQICAFIP